MQIQRVETLRTRGSAVTSSQAPATKASPEMVRAYKSGLGARVVGRMFGLDQRVARARLVASGVELRPPGVHGRRKLPDPVPPDMEADRRAGAPITALAAKYGRAERTIRKMLIAAGIDPAPDAEEL